MKIPVPTLTDQQRQQIIRGRKSLNCDRIYNNRNKSFMANLQVLTKRLFQIEAKSDLTPLSEQAHIIALKEKALCESYKAIPEITEEFRRCREVQIDQWQKDFLRSVAENESLEKVERKTKQVGKLVDRDAENRLRVTLYNQLFESLQKVLSDGLALEDRMNAYELKRWQHSDRD